MLNEYSFFKSAENFYKIYESQINGDDEKDEIDDLNDEDENPNNLSDPTVQDNTDTINPEDNADVENGEFISDLKKAEFAKLILNALMQTPPEMGTIPDEYLNVTTNNADEVIKFIKNIISLNSSLSLDDGNSDIVDALQND